MEASLRVATPSTRPALTGGGFVSVPYQPAYPGSNRRDVKPATGEHLEAEAAMAPTHHYGFESITTPDPPLLEPIGYTSWGPIWPGVGGRVQSRGMEFITDDGDDDDPFDDDDDDDGDEDDERDERAEERQREQDRRDAARGWQKPKKQQRQRREEPDEDDEADEPDEGEELDEAASTRRTRGRRGSAEDTDEWTPPTREQWENVTAAVKRNNDENFKRRYVAKAMKRLGIDDEDGFRDFLITNGIDPDSGKRLNGIDSDHEAETDLFGQEGDEQSEERDQSPRLTRADIIAERRRAEERGTARAAAKFKDGVALFAAEAALREAGWNGKDLDLALRLVDLETVEVDFDDRGRPVVYNIDEQVKRIKEDVPEWFRPRREPRDTDRDAAERRERRPARRVGGVREVDGGERRKPAARPQTWLERANDQMMGRGR